MNTIISDSYYYLMNILNHMKNLKLNDHLDRGVADCYDAILVNVESFDSARAFKPDHLGYSICVFEDTSDARFHI